MRASAGLLISGLMLASSQEPPRFSSDVQLVMVDVQVTEKGTGRILDLLSPSDLEVYDNGQRRDIKEFHFESSPLDVVFLTYGKSGLGPMKDIRAFYEALNAAAEALRPGDRGAVLRTDSERKVDLQLTDDREKVRHALVRGDQYPTGHDHLFDALRVATTLFPKQRERIRRRAIVAITDDIERRSKTTLDQVTIELLEADATLYGVVVVPGKQGGREIGVGGVWGIPRVSREVGSGRKGDSIRAAVEATGGDSISGDRLQDDFPELIRRMSLRYMLGFYAPAAKQREYRTIEVRLSPQARKQYPNAIVRARRGYYAGSTDVRSDTRQ